MKFKLSLLLVKTPALSILLTAVTLFSFDSAMANCGELLIFSKMGVMHIPPIDQWAKPPPKSKKNSTQITRDKNKLKRKDLITHWYTAVELGYHDKYLAANPNTELRKVMRIEPEHGAAFNPAEMYLHKSAPDDEGVYYARISERGFLSGQRFDLFGIRSNTELRDLVDRNFEVTWNIYKETGTVTDNEIKQFQAHEKALDPQRKVTFATSTKSGDLVAVVRLYDGSPFPALFLGHGPLFTETPDTDPRLPIERRYPHLNFRKDGPFVFEAGRQAKSPKIEDIFTQQLVRMAYYFWNKFGDPDEAPDIYREHGRVYVEITGKHLKMYMAEAAKGGLGFKLFAQARDGQTMKLVENNPSYSELSVDRHITSDKFILSKSVLDFIRDFGGGDYSHDQFKAIQREGNEPN